MTAKKSHQTIHPIHSFIHFIYLFNILLTQFKFHVSAAVGLYIYLNLFTFIPTPFFFLSLFVALHNEILLVYIKTQ